VGLNLQHAAALVVNMDLPWNPAVLEQRIGRVHRMGQSRGVQVLNLIGQGSIEEGMLGVLAFKKSLFAGVLDGGASEVFLQGTRLASFMKSVEEVAGAMGTDEGDEVAAAPAAAAAPPPAGTGQQQPEALAETPATPAPGRAATEETPVAAAPAMAPEAAAAEGDRPAPAADPWADLLHVGAAVLQGLAAQRGQGGASPIRIERDPATGQPSLRLPLPDPALLQRLAQALAPWLRP